MAAFIKDINPFTVAMAAVVGIFLDGFGIVIMHFLLPRKIVEKYFKPPHFSMTEPAYFSGKVLPINISVMFMALAAFPRLGKKRKLTQMYKEVPIWYRIASRILLIFMLSCLAVVIGVVAIFA